MDSSKAGPDRDLAFEVGGIYKRQDDIHIPFGGSWQSGISASARTPAIFIFTGVSGEQYGYRDEFDAAGVFTYTGEGQLGDMVMKSGNLAISRHAADGKALHLFRSLGKGKGHQYLGEFSCSDVEWKDGPDRTGAMRKVIVFHLVPVARIDEAAVSNAGVPAPENITEARRLAIEAVAPQETAAPGQSIRLIYQRSERVRQYVLMRANGICESCRKPAPFTRKDGSPYLEPHHINRLSDGGLDHPKFIGAICPTCHREIHYGLQGPEINEQLRTYVERVEGTIWV